MLNPTKIIENANGTKTLEFRDNTTQSFLNQYKIHLYNREFEWSRFTSLHKYYIIGIESANQVNPLLSNANIVLAEYIGTDEDIDNQTLGTPNDYYDHEHISEYWLPDGTYDTINGFVRPVQPFKTTNFRAYEHLELIKARRAWNITTGVYYNYILNAENNSISIPTNQLPTGTYIVNLIANGNMLDVKQLIIN